MARAAATQRADAQEPPYAPTGALLAAPTTSLPEHPGGTRNWDYRYTWVRDAAFALWALHALGFDAEAEDFLAFLGDVLDTESHTAAEPAHGLRVLYSVDGTAPLEEIELDHLTGYGGSRPVRVGNAAQHQRQFDIWGAAVDCVYQHTRSRGSLSERAWRIVVYAVEHALRGWREPDQSIWEIRAEPQHFTYSKVMCWVAADRGSRLAALRGERDLAGRWWDAALEIHADVCKRGVDHAGRFTQTYGSDQLDASLLVLPLFRFLPPTDERLRATVLAIADELSEDGFVHRYRQTQRKTASTSRSRRSRSARSGWSRRSSRSANSIADASCASGCSGSASSLCLYAEEIDPSTSRHLGNYPQALTHLALVNAVLHVIDAERHASEPLVGPAAPPSWWAAAGTDGRTDTKSAY